MEIEKNEIKKTNKLSKITDERKPAVISEQAEPEHCK